MPAITTNTTTGGALSSAPSTQEWSLIDIVKFCNQAHLSGIRFQSESLNLMSNKMNNQQTFQDDCNNRTADAEKRSDIMNTFNIAWTVINSVVLLPAAIALSCIAGPEVLGLDAMASGAVQAVTTGVDIASGVASLTLGTGLAVTQLQLGQDEQAIQTDTGAIQNGGNQVKQLSDIVTDIMKAEQSQGQMVSTCINNATQAQTAYKHRES